LNENIKEAVVETVKEDVETDEEHIERHAERQEFNHHIQTLIDERVNHKPIVKSKFKLVDCMYILRDGKFVVIKDERE
jgi:hypothetical protein